MLQAVEVRDHLARLFRRFMPVAPGPRWPRLSPVARAVERMVHLSDSALSIPGTRVRVGLDPLFGLIFPVIGDALGGMLSLGVLFLAVQYRVPPRVMTRMVLNVALDAAVGSIPIVGDVFDFGWKANDRNFQLLMTHRGDMPKRTTLGYWLRIGALLLLSVCLIAAPVALLLWLLLRGRYLQ